MCNMRDAMKSPQTARSFDLWIAGQPTPSLSGETITRTSPAHGYVVTTIAAGNREDVNLAVAAAKASFEKGTWANMAGADL
jgi:acyl-CoA reductase-like NAD-dependent aldehyde dehydrogenase